MTGALRLDLHVHSRYSPDSRLELEEIVAAIRRRGLQGFALTDHNTVAGHEALGRLAAQQSDLLLVPGVEVSTREGHLLVLGVGEAPPRGESLETTFAWVQQHGGVAVVAHPMRWTHGVGRKRAATAPVSAIETVNAQSSPTANRRAAAVAAARVGVAPTGGSDAHRAEAVGRAYTVFPAPLRTVDGVLDLLRRGAARAEGESLGIGGRLRWAARNAWLRAGRGFRAV